MISEGVIAKLIREDGDLFTEARKTARTRSLIISSPLVLTRACKVSPLCRHCRWRAPRTLMRNYATAKTSLEEAVSRAIHLEKSGVSRVYLVSGWMDTLPNYFYDCVEGIRKNTGIEIVANFGAINKSDMTRLKESGVDSINCALETTNIKVFQNLKPGDSFDARFKTLQDAKDLGFKTCTNLLIGIGESIEDMDTSIRTADQLGIDFLTVSSIQPTPFTETENWDRPKMSFVGRIGAAARICLKDNVDIGMYFDSSADFAWGMRCGANAFTLSFRNPGESPELLGDDISRLKTMWQDYRELGRENKAAEC